MSAKFHTIQVPTLTEQITTDPHWDKVITVGWEQFVTMHVGDGLEIVSNDGVFIGEIEDVGDFESRENYIRVDLM